MTFDIKKLLLTGRMPGKYFDRFDVKNALDEIQEELESNFYKNPEQVQDWGGEAVEGTFYEAELQRVKQDDTDVFKIEKILKQRKTRNGKVQNFVKWAGYPEKFNSWTDQVVKL